MMSAAASAAPAKKAAVELQHEVTVEVRGPKIARPGAWMLLLAVHECFGQLASKDADSSAELVRAAT